MEQKPHQTPELTHEERIERIQKLCAALQTALDTAEEQRRVLRDVARAASELADAMESAATHDHTIDRRRTSRKKR
jgi:hypothetical protein